MGTKGGSARYLLHGEALGLVEQALPYEQHGIVRDRVLLAVLAAHLLYLLQARLVVRTALLL